MAFVHPSRHRDHDNSENNRQVVEHEETGTVGFQRSSGKDSAAAAALAGAVKVLTDPRTGRQLADTYKRGKDLWNNRPGRGRSHNPRYKSPYDVRLKAKPDSGDGGGDPKTPKGPGKPPGRTKRKRKRGNGGGGGGGSVGTTGTTATAGVSEISFSSGIRAGITVNRRHIDEWYSSMFLASGTLLLDNDLRVLDNPIWGQLIDIMYPYYVNVISLKINKYVDTETRFTEDAFEAWFQSIVKALQIYYCIDDVLAYNRNNTLDNINPGMENLFSHVNSNVQFEMDELRRLLQTIPIHPRLLEYIRWSCQTYRQTNAPHAALIKLNIFNIFSEPILASDPSISDNIAQIIRDCRSEITENNTITSFMLQAFKEWVVTLPQSTNVAEFDLNFWTFWHNLDQAYVSPEEVVGEGPIFKYTRDVDNDNAYMSFNIFQKDEEVDGLIYAACTSHVRLDPSVQSAYSVYYGFWNPWAVMEVAYVDPATRDANAYTLKCFVPSKMFVSISEPIIRTDAGVFSQAYLDDDGEWKRLERGMPGRIELQASTSRLQREAFEASVRYLFAPAE